MPTPAIAYLTRTLRGLAGIAISASHNQYEDNGIKFFNANGAKLDDDVERQIEHEMQQPLRCVPSKALGKVIRIDDAPGRYIEFCKSTIPPHTRLTGLKIVVDSANGAAYHIAPKVFIELGAKVISINDTPDGFNINTHCGSTNPQQLQQAVIDHSADIGIALDGDGDRCIMVNDRGDVVNGDVILYIIARYRQFRNHLDGGIVGTELSNLGLEQAFKKMNIPFERAQVGDRYVISMLAKNNWKIGGEPSGHIVCLDKSTTGDGIIAALQVLNAMVKLQKSLTDLYRDLIIYPQHCINIKTHKARELLDLQATKAALQQIQTEMNNTGRIIVRPSGTEPVIRIMVEGPTTGFAKNHAEAFASVLTDIAATLD